MVESRRSQIILAGVSGACALVAFSALALAQNRPDLECKKTETQAECHARLKCKPDEDLEDCKKRLRAAAQQGGNDGQRNDGDRGGGDRDQGRDRDVDQGRDRDADRGRGRRDRDADRGGDRRGRDRGARSRRQRDREGGRGFEANKTFGLGLELGEPSGLNGKYFVSDAAALDFGVGWVYRHYYYGDGAHLYADFLYHPVTLTSAAAFELPLYIGGGLRFWDFDYCFQNVCGYGGSAVGIRVPFGISFDFNNAPLDIFIQLVPVIDFLNGDYYNRFDDRTHLGIDLSLGLRYWFK